MKQKDLIPHFQGCFERCTYIGICEECLQDDLWFFTACEIIRYANYIFCCV